MLNTDFAYLRRVRHGQWRRAGDHAGAKPRRGAVAGADAAAARRIVPASRAPDRPGSMQHLPDALLPGRPFPLGATWDGLGINFAVFSAHARAGSTCACSNRPDAMRSRAIRCRNTPTKSGTAICPMRRPGVLYGYRAYGPYAPEHGHRFNPSQAAARPLCSGAGWQPSTGRTRCTASASTRRAATCRSTGATVRRRCRKAW